MPFKNKVCVSKQSCQSSESPIVWSLNWSRVYDPRVSDCQDKVGEKILWTAKILVRKKIDMEFLVGNVTDSMRVVKWCLFLIVSSITLCAKLFHCPARVRPSKSNGNLSKLSKKPNFRSKYYTDIRFCSLTHKQRDIGPSLHSPPLFLIQMCGKGKILSHGSVESDRGVATLHWIMKTDMGNITGP